jgi:hypothetical protein
LRAPAWAEPLRSQPYWWPTTVPTSQLLDAALPQKMREFFNFGGKRDFVKKAGNTNSHKFANYM